MLCEQNTNFWLTKNHLNFENVYMQNKIIGLKLKKLRTERALNQFELGKKLNVSRTAVGNWERGERSINITDLTAISLFFGVPLTYFTSDSVDDEPLTK